MTSPYLSRAITKEQHDALMATRKRPLTDDWMERRKVDDGCGETAVSLVDAYLIAYFKGEGK